MRSVFAACVGALLLVCEVSAAQAKLKVFACEPEWAALAMAIGGGRVEATSPTTALDDPEQGNPPAAMASAMQAADMFVCTGLDMEETWLESVLDKASSNAKVAEGQPGHFHAAEVVKVLKDEMPLLQHDESKPHTHLHHGGNGHIEGDPHNVVRVAGALAKRLIQIDQDGKDYYTEREKKFIADMNAKIAELEKKAAPLKGVVIASQHEHSLYLVKWLGMHTAATIEPEPGVEPNQAQLDKVVADIAAKKIKFIVYGAYQDPKSSKYVAEKAGVPLVKL